MVISSYFGRCQSFNYKENAVYIFNIVKNTTFTTAKSSITIGVLGNSPIEAELKTLLAKKGTSYILKHITPTEVTNVDVIIVALSASKNLKEIQTNTAKLPILIITEKADLNYNGACISLFMDEEDDYKTKYQLSPFNLRARGLTMNQLIINNAILVR
jgi:hypothetical protein